MFLRAQRKEPDLEVFVTASKHKNRTFQFQNIKMPKVQRFYWEYLFNNNKFYLIYTLNPYLMMFNL